jgi:hypothetical protein
MRSSAVAFLLSRYRALPAVAAAVEWHPQVWDLVRGAVAQGRWITREAADGLRAAHPGPNAVAALTAAPDVVSSLPADQQEAVALLTVDLDAWVAANNETILAHETRQHAGPGRPASRRLSRPHPPSTPRRAPACADDARIEPRGTLSGARDGPSAGPHGVRCQQRRPSERPGGVARADSSPDDRR